MPVKDVDKYRRFAEYYYALTTDTYKNIYRSAVKAGYSHTYASRLGKRLLETVGIKKALEKKRKSVEHLLAADVADTAEVLKTMTFGIRFRPKELFDENDKLRPIRELPDEIAYMLGGIEITEKILTDDDTTGQTITERKIKYKFPDKKSYLTEFVKILGLTNGNKDAVEDLLRQAGILVQVNNEEHYHFNLEASESLKNVITEIRQKHDK